MVYDAPKIGAVLPSFLEFFRGCVLVAHNAPFDVGFLRASCARLNLPWPGPAVVDTVRLARRVLPAPRHPACGCPRSPHCSVPVSRPTTGRSPMPGPPSTSCTRSSMSGMGGAQPSELRTLSKDVAPDRRRKRMLADHLPAAPGVYLSAGQGTKFFMRDIREPAPTGAVVFFRCRDQGPDQAHGRSRRTGRPR